MKGSNKILVLLLVLGILGAMAVPVFAMTGAIYTTDSDCSGVNVNLFDSKQDVYLDGGPAGGGSGLPDGYYYVKVTEPNGDAAWATRQPQRRDGHSVAILSNATSCGPSWSTTSRRNPGLCRYHQPGGEYKVWVSPTADLRRAKTDNFKVKAGVTPAILNVMKFYDANANGINDDGQLITGWKVSIEDGIDFDPLHAGDHPAGPGRLHRNRVYAAGDQLDGHHADPVYVTLPPGDDETVEFGNLCLGAGGGLTLGFWSNKNGQALFGADDLAHDGRPEPAQRQLAPTSIRPTTRLPHLAARAQTRPTWPTCSLRSSRPWSSTSSTARSTAVR